MADIAKKSKRNKKQLKKKENSGVKRKIDSQDDEPTNDQGTAKVSEIFLKTEYSYDDNEEDNDSSSVDVNKIKEENDTAEDSTVRREEVKSGNYNLDDKSDPSEEHIRHLMLFHFQAGFNATDATKEICEVYGDVLQVSRVERWFRKFSCGDFDLEIEW